MRAAPACHSGCHFFRSPFLRLVPSGNIATICPARASSTARAMASASLCPRRTLNAPAPEMNAPSGHQ